METTGIINDIVDEIVTCGRVFSSNFSQVFHSHSLNSLYLLLGVRSLANASRARQFNPLNPHGVEWVKFFLR